MNSVPDGLALRIAAADLSQLADLLVLCIDLAASSDELVTWWRAPQHQAAMKLLPPAELERVVAAKDMRKMGLSFGS